MTTDELKEWMDERLGSLEGRILERCNFEKECRLDMQRQIKANTIWISRVKGAWAAIAALAGIIGIKWIWWGK